MRTKLKLEPKVVTQTTLKTRLIKYGGGGLAILSVIGAIMWFYLQVGDQEQSMASTGGIAPANDTKSGAVWLTDLYEDQSAFAAFTNENATTDAVSGSCFNSGSGQGVWFKFKALYSDATITVKTGSALGSIQNLEIALFDAADNEVSCAVASGSSFATITTSALTTDSWYYLLVNSKTSADTGTFTLYINNVSPVKYYVRRDDDWDKNSTWSTSGYGGPAASSIPGKANVVFIKDADGDVKIDNITAECAGLIIESGSKKSKLEIESNGKLNVFGRLFMDGSASSSKELEVKVDNAVLYVQDSFLLEKNNGSKEAKIKVKNSKLTVEKTFMVKHSGGKYPKIEFENSDTVDIGEDVILVKDGGYGGYKFNLENTNINVSGDFLVVFSSGSGTYSFDFKDNSTFNVNGNATFLKNGGSNTLDVLFEQNISSSIGGNLEVKFESGSSNFYFEFKDNCSVAVSGDYNIIKDGGNNKLSVIMEDGMSFNVAGDHIVKYLSGSSNLEYRFKKNSTLIIGGDLNFEKDGGTNNLDIEIDENVNASVAGDMDVIYSGGSASLYLDFKNNSTLSIGRDMTMTKSGGSSKLQVKFEENCDIFIGRNAYLSLDGGSSTYDFYLRKNSTMKVDSNITLRETGGSNDFDFVVGSSSSSEKDTLSVGGDFRFGADNGNSSNYKLDASFNRSSRFTLMGDIIALTNKGRLNFKDDQAKLLLLGEQQQSIAGEVLSGDLVVKYRNIYVNNHYGGPSDTAAAVIVNGSVTIEEELELVDGIVRVNSPDAITFDKNMTLSGGSDSSFIDGAVIKEGSYNMLIPIGDEGVYAPVELNDYSNSSSSNKMKVQYIRDPYADTSLGSGLAGVSKIEHWNIEKVNGSSSLKVKIVLHWSDGAASGISDLNDLAIAHYDGSEWVAVQPASINGTVTQGSIGSNYGQNGFGPYTFGTTGGGNVLPIKLNDFSVSLQNDQSVLLSWETAMEHNNDFFTLERSYDGRYFEEIGTVRGAGNSDMPLSYTYVDEAPGSGNIYYRLKQTDYDGQFEYFNVEQVYIEAISSSMEIEEVYPVPFSDQLTLILESGIDAEVRVDLVAMGGTQIPVMVAELHSGRNSIQLANLGNLPPGAYVLTITSSDKQISTKVLKAR